MSFMMQGSMGGPVLRSLPFNPLGNQSAKKPRLANKSNGLVIGRDVHNSEQGSILRANWILRVHPMKTDPKMDYTNDIPHGALVWVRLKVEEKGYSVDNGTYHSYDSRPKQYSIAVVTPVLNMILAKQGKMSPSAQAIMKIGGNPTPDTVRRDWTLGGICNNHVTDAKFNTTERYLVLERINDIPILNMWHRNVEPMQYLFMVAVAQRPRDYTHYIPHSSGNYPEVISNISEETQRPIPYTVQLFPMVSNDARPPTESYTTMLRHPDSSVTPILGHCYRVGIVMSGLEQRFLDTGDVKPFIDTINEMEIESCTSMPKMVNLTMVHTKLAIA